MKRIICLALMVLPLALTARAEEKQLTAPEVLELLSGNSIKGNWFGEDYKQYFSPDGATYYAPRKARPSRGKWRVNETTDMYESWWERTNWVPYKIVRINGDLHWLGDSNKPQPFIVVEGKHLTWSEGE